KIILISEIIIFNAVGFLIYFLSLEFIIVLISAFSSSGLWIMTAMFSGTKTGAQSTGGMNDSGSRDYPKFNCPNCTTEISIPSDERPLRISCSGCNKVLKIVD
ncbi:MAG TPA: hypothetical protein QF644_02425, partial [Candidatus Poseidoniaceae archaeon]|nr:hypothetical protein [Candidatus Poseidoniaceae archaeon]